MTDVQYTLRYLPIFYEDVKEKVDYILDVLKNPTAANALLDAVEKAILERLNCPESFEPYHSVMERKYPYYRIYVKNYTVYYVVIPVSDKEKIMEIRRFLFNRQDTSKWI